MASFTVAVLSSVALIQVLTSTISVQAVKINTHPEDQFASVGGFARFMCGYNETLRFPYWLINGVLFTTQGLPERHSFRSQVLTVRDVQASDNLTTYQCAFSGIRSQQATLFVWPTNTDDDTENTTTSTITTLLLTASTTKTTDAASIATFTTEPTVNFSVKTFTKRMPIGSHMLRQDDSVLIAAVAGSGSVIITIFFTASIVLTVMIAKKHRKRKKLNRDFSDERPYEEVKDALQTSLNVMLKHNPSYVTRKEIQDITIEDCPIYAEIEEKVKITANIAYHSVLLKQDMSIKCEVPIQEANL